MKTQPQANADNRGTEPKNPSTHFGTLRIQPVLVRVLTSQPAEDPGDYDHACRIFDHVRGRLLRLAPEIAKELGEGWQVMIEDED